MRKKHNFFLRLLECENKFEESINIIERNATEMIKICVNVAIFMLFTVNTNKLGVTPHLRFSRAIFRVTLHRHSLR